MLTFGFLRTVFRIILKMALMEGVGLLIVDRGILMCRNTEHWSLQLQLFLVLLIAKHKETFAAGHRDGFQLYY